MESFTDTTAPDRALASAYRFQQQVPKMLSKRSSSTVRDDSPPRMLNGYSPFGLHERLSQTQEQRGTVLYLAYGSNLSKETFRGKRGIKPLSQTNVQVPSLRLTFDLPGIPYGEPCFANSGRRDPNDDPPKAQQISGLGEKAPLLSGNRERSEYRKDEWHKGLIGVIYEVTPEDYAHIIATEGGGASYHDILVDCHPFSTADPSVPVPQNPTSPAIKAHTLFAPATPSGEDPPRDGGRFQRPDTSYAQASARYLKLITDGAAECDLPYEYQEYLRTIRPYTVTSNKQRLGSYIFLGLWLPFVMMVFGLNAMFVDENGRIPDWLKQLTGAIFKACWASYDGFFKPIFGDGERSIPDGGDDAPDEKSCGREGDFVRTETPSRLLPDLEMAVHTAQM